MGCSFVKNKERGSSSVFLLLVLAGLISLALVYIAGAEHVMAESYGEDVLHLAGRSVLAEYDRDLKNEYGIMAFSGSGRDVRTRLMMYGAYAFSERCGMAVKDLAVDLGAYGLCDVENFRTEIIGYTKYALARGLLKDMVSGESLSSSGEGVPLVLDSDHTLRHQKVIKALPSAGRKTGGDLWKSVKNAFSDFDRIFEKGTDNYLLNTYIFSQCKSAQQQDTGRETLFDYEIEYILMGHLSDAKNLAAVRTELLLVRNAADLLFLYTDPVKREELIAAAEVLAPGPGALLVQAILAETWALAEAENDMRILEHGKKVPLYKNSDTWAVDLASVLEEREGDYIDTGCEVGMTYQDYLRALMFFLDGETKVLRLMDLIQINMQGNYDRHFLLQDHYLGYGFSATWNGRGHYYEHTY